MTDTLAEVIADKRYLDKKIAELKKVVTKVPNDNLVQELLALIEIRQARMLNIEAANNASMINIGGTEVSIAVAVQLRKTVKEKADLLTSMIENDESGLDIVTLQKQRDKYQREYTLLTLGITRNDLKVTIG